MKCLSFYKIYSGFARWWITTAIKKLLPHLHVLLYIFTPYNRTIDDHWRLEQKTGNSTDMETNGPKDSINWQPDERNLAEPNSAEVAVGQRRLQIAPGGCLHKTKGGRWQCSQTLCTLSTQHNLMLYEIHGLCFYTTDSHWLSLTFKKRVTANWFQLKPFSFHILKQ